MKLNLSLKDTHMIIIDDLKDEHSISSSEEVVCRYVKSALRLEKNDLIFGVSREQCGAGCFASEPRFEIDLEEDDLNKLSKIYQDYDFQEYDTKEEEISKTIRCIINFVEEKPDLISI
tara:strand:- start:189 stop:542 length:354 start_codon:yes stop_codon:yes gene_type:complete